MQVMTLKFSFHGANVPVPDHEGRLRWTLVAAPRTDNSRLVFHLKSSGSTQGEAEDTNVVIATFKQFLIICVPTNGVVPISIEIDVATIGLCSQARNSHTVFTDSSHEVGFHGGLDGHA